MMMRTISLIGVVIPSAATTTTATGIIPIPLPIPVSVSLFALHILVPCGQSRKYILSVIFWCSGMLRHLVYAYNTALVKNENGNENNIQNIKDIIRDVTDKPKKETIFVTLVSVLLTIMAPTITFQTLPT